MATTDEKIDRLMNGVAKVIKLLEKPAYRPASTNFYSPTMGQLQFAVGSPTWKAPEDKNGQKVSYVAKEGAVFIEAAPPDKTREGKLDWENKKIVFALSDKDVATIVYALERNKVDKNGNLVNITHTNGDVVKYFKIRPGQPNKDGDMTYGLEVQDMSTKNKVGAYVLGPDLMRLKILLEHAMTKILGWDVA